MLKRLIFFLFIGSFLLISCSKEDKDGPESGYKKNITGTWTASEYSTNGTDFYTWDYINTFVSFSSSGSAFGDGLFGYFAGTWTINNNVIKLYSAKEEKGTYTIENISSNTCIMSVNQGGLQMTVKWKKHIDTSDDTENTIPEITAPK